MRYSAIDLLRLIETAEPVAPQEHAINEPAALSEVLQRFGVARCVQKLNRARAVAWFQECQSSAS
jgi:hypothetical protein